MITIKGIDPNMIANNLTLSNPIHPGEMIKDEIEYRGISQKKLAEQTGISYTALNEVLNCKRPVSTEYALLLEAALGIEANIWIKTQIEFDIQMIRSSPTCSQRIENIRKLVAVL